MFKETTYLSVLLYLLLTPITTITLSPLLICLILSNLHLINKLINKQISFLDVLVTNDRDQFCTSVFHKETAIDLFTNYVGFAPFSYKVGLVRTLLHHTFMISNSWFLFHEVLILSIIQKNILITEVLLISKSSSFLRRT